MAVLAGIFVVTVALREPWRGHLAKGDQWVTALALRWVRAWHRDGAWAQRFALVESPPTAEFAGDRQVHKWGFPGQALLIHAVAQPLGLEPDVELLNRVNLGLHLLLALVLATAAYLLARATWSDRPDRAPLVALHCGAFVLLFPPILYWGQNVICQDFAVLPLLAFIVVARWLRPTAASRRARIALDAGVATAVFLGTVTEFLFLVVVPWLVLVRWLAAWRDRPRTTDPWPWTLALPFLLALACLTAIFVENGQLALLRWRLGSWTLGGSDVPGVPFLAVRLFLLLLFLKTHFLDAFGLLGLLALAVAALKLSRPARVPGLPPAARGILLDLLVPCLLFTFALAHHQAFHTIAAMKYVPFVALAWTFLTPLLIDGTRPGRRRILRAVYAVVALLAILPFSSAYRQFFPAPELRWDAEGAFLREAVPPTDVVVSPVTEIDLVPPQRIALAERRVTHVYGPLDLAHRTAALDDDTMVALYGPPGLRRAFGADDAQVVERGEFAVTRFPLQRFRAFLRGRADAALREHLAEVLRGDLGTASAPHRRFEGTVPAPRPPLAIHLTDARRATLGGWDRLYWTDERHVHWRAFQEGSARAREFVVLDGSRYATDWMMLWRGVPAVEEAPLEWGRFILGLGARAAANAAETFGWRGYDVVAIPAGPAPALLRARWPAVTDWTAHLLLRDGALAGVAVGPTGAAADASWTAVLFDELAVDVALPDYVSTDWTVKHDNLH